MIYTPSAGSKALQQLVFASLGIQSLFKENLKHNVVDRDQVVVPPCWDSWGKIRVLREGFDVEAVSVGWSGDLRDYETAYRDSSSVKGSANPVEDGLEKDSPQTTGIIPLYENTIRNPQRDDALAAIALSQKRSETIEVKSLGTQDFLAQQAESLERSKTEESGGEDKKNIPGESFRRADHDASASQGDPAVRDDNRVKEHIGPVQFNMGGIQVDADDMLKKLKVCGDLEWFNRLLIKKQDREANRTPEPETAPVTSPDGKTQNEALATFFAGLMKRGTNTSSNSLR